MVLSFGILIDKVKAVGHPVINGTPRFKNPELNTQLSTGDVSRRREPSPMDN